MVTPLSDISLFSYSYNDCQSRLNDMERTAKELGGKLEEIQVARSTAEADLAIEKQWRASLQVHLLASSRKVPVSLTCM